MTTISEFFPKVEHFPFSLQQRPLPLPFPASSGFPKYFKIFMSPSKQNLATPLKFAEYMGLILDRDQNAVSKKKQQVIDEIMQI